MKTPQIVSWLLVASSFLLFIASAQSARADCTSPAWPEGAHYYDFTAHALKLCTGTSWVSLSAGGGSSQWVNGTSGAIYYNGGNVGIGTTAPVTLLHISTATADAEIRLNTTGANKSILGLANAGTDYGQVYFDNSTNDVVIYQKFTSGGMVFGTNSAPRMRIDNSGNVGIGTTTPSQKLDVNGTVTATSFNIGYEKHDCCSLVSSSASNNAWTAMVSLCPAGKKLIFVECYTSGGGSLPNGTRIISQIDSTGQQAQCYNGSGAGAGIYIGSYVCARVQ